MYLTFVANKYANSVALIFLACDMTKIDYLQDFANNSEYEVVCQNSVISTCLGILDKMFLEV